MGEYRENNSPLLKVPVIDGRKRAAALKYKQESQRAPKLLAKGQGDIAERIIAKAKEFEVPIFQNRELVNSLINLEIDEEIPTHLYRAVVEVFIWLHKSENSTRASQK